MADISPIQIHQQQLIKTYRERRKECAIKQHAVSAVSQLGLDAETILKLH
jgi:hypothetical protein